jgi:LmbE family N-acetylglucosaminyl deacetylase
VTAAVEALAPLEPAARLLRWLEAGGAGRAPETMIVAAHPDDEVIGAGAQLAKLPGLAIVHTTDGAPRDGRDANAAGFAKWQAYARARRRELAAALKLAGIPEGAARQLDFADQGASFHLVALTQALATTLEEIRPDVVITHPYEGGHPDHDATAFAVHAACTLLARRGLRPPALLEMTCYHAGNGGMVTSRFLPWPGTQVTTLALDGAAREAKRQLVACFATQRQVLAQFPIEVERFRPAPPYDFARPPHGGQLYYEHFPWGVDGLRWREMARGALCELGLSFGP